MIVKCENCHSAFKIDDNLLKEKNLRLRCSKCKHVFNVFPPEEPANTKKDLTEKSNLSGWKKDALKDFTSWLEDISDKYQFDEAPLPDSCDLYTLLSEFSALRQEIKIQNREQSKALKTHNSFINAYRETADLFKDRSKKLAELEKNISKSSEKRAVMPFLDIRDALVRGRDAGLNLSESHSSHQKIEEIEGIVEGYEMAIRRFDRALALLDIYPTNSVGRPFDPKIMKAVDKTYLPDMEKNMVIEEQLSGFIRDEEVLRTAEVIVNNE
ncbi:molecular chaperone GrpE [Candidatus Magnetomoraceae bacterium gMMP-15]